MRLSEAIRLGAMLNPQARFSRHRQDGSSCALGAAEDASGCTRGEYYETEEIFPELVKCYTHPITGKVVQMQWIIAQLNNGSFRPYGEEGDPFDFPAWTRERIADWVETVEQAQPDLAANRDEAKEEEVHA